MHLHGYGFNWDRRRDRTTVVTLCGDLNHDEPLSTVDVTLALPMAANNTDINFSADANSDGAVTPVNYEVSRHPFSEVSSVLD